jgi:hypothetical protein
VDDTPAANGLAPRRVALFLTAVVTPDGNLEDEVGSVIEDAESRGLFFEWAAIGDMDINDVIPNSPLHHALMGRPPDR